MADPIPSPALLARIDRAEIRLAPILAMHRAHGEAPGHACGECAELGRRTRGGRFWCRRSSDQAEWRKCWGSCGLLLRVKTTSEYPKTEEKDQ